MYKMPNEKGLIFYFTWAKTIRGMTHVFGMMCICEEEPDLCAVCSIEEYVDFAKEMGWDFRTGCLFSDMKIVGNALTRVPGPNSTQKMNYALRKY